MDDYRNKIKSLETLTRDIRDLKSRGRKIVFTNGCFDILHPGHTRYLWQARQLGDYLVVAVNSDRSVRAIKGAERPVVPQDGRTEVLAALACVDAVVLFDEETPLRVIEALLPHVLVKGGDWAEDRIVGADAVRRAGGEVRSIPYVEGHSTTAVLAKIRRL
jgi:D-beta-D-heptose 7-phosphate kinase/D-beta-D-heptose 1-phosphate adenosyltransferase